MGETIFGLVSLLIGFFSVWQWSKVNAEKKQAKKVAKEKTEDAKISTKPYVDKPFSKLRNKK